MRTIAKFMWTAIAALVLVSSGASSAVRAQVQPSTAPAPPPSPPDQPVVTPAEIQRMFEAVALVRAQEVLKLSDDNYLPFLAKFKALQDVRRRTQQEHNRLMNDLRRLTNDASSDEGQLKDRMKALQDLDARSEAELLRAYEGVDSVLDVRQKAKFRVFEENMERQKMDLLTKARQVSRPQPKSP